MIELFTTAFVTFVVIIDPPGCAPIFASLTSGTAQAHRRKMAIRSSLVAWFILLFFALLGEPLLRTLGISLSAFRLAGGIMLFIIALEMVFEKRTEHDQERAERALHEPPVADLAVFPMAMPMIAGPGSIASVMLLTAKARGWVEELVVLGALASVLLLMLLALLSASSLMRLVGSRVEGVITRVLGVLLSALAVQYVIDGVRGVLALH